MDCFRRILKFVNFLQRTKSISKKSYLFLIQDYLSLRRKIKLSPDEYFDFEFEKKDVDFRESFLSEIQKENYIRLLNPKKYYILARNKYLTHLYLDTLGIRQTTLYCYYHPECRIQDDTIAFDFDSVVAVLKFKNIKNCVIKSTESGHGEGVILIDTIIYSEDECMLFQQDGKMIRLKDLLKYEPLLFEQVIRQTNQFAQFNSTSVNTVRFMTTLHPDGNADIIATWIRFGRYGSCVDNAGTGRNVSAAVDKKTGRIYNATLFNGWRNTKPVTHHPDSGVLLEGTVIEDWEKISSDILRFQQAIPLLKAIAWDIAITDEGPLVVEINDSWDPTGQFFILHGWRKEIQKCFLEWKRLVDAGLVSYWSGRGIDQAYLNHTKAKYNNLFNG